MTIKIRLFGSFRDCEESSELILSAEGMTRISELRGHLQTELAPRWSSRHLGLLQHSVFASDFDVLRDEDSIPEHGDLALLPPVSGG